MRSFLKTDKDPFILHSQYHGPLARYVTLRVAYAPRMPGTFSPPAQVSNPNMHHGTCVTHVPWCMTGSLTSGFLWSRWRGKRPRHSRRMCSPQFLRIWYIYICKYLMLNLWILLQNLYNISYCPWESRSCLVLLVLMWFHDDVIKWKHFPRYWPFVQGIHRSPASDAELWYFLWSALERSNVWVNNRDAGDLRRHRAHYDVTVKCKRYGQRLGK